RPSESSTTCGMVPRRRPPPTGAPACDHSTARRGRVLDLLPPPPGTAEEGRALRLSAVVPVEVLAAQLDLRRASDSIPGFAPPERTREGEAPHRTTLRTARLADG